VKQSSLESAPADELYIPFLQRPIRDLTLVARTAGNPETLAPALGAAVAAVDKDLPVSNVNTAAGLLARSVSRPRVNMLLLAVFAALATALAAVGVYGVLSFAVTERTREIGIRMALGARAGDVLRFVIGRGMLLAAIGIALGILGALGLTRLLRRLLFQTSPTDPAVFLAAALGLGAVALLACYLPARRGTRVDPMSALRQE
jgi:putative ABC transport system permease protein